MKRPNKQDYFVNGCLDTDAYEKALNDYIEATEENAADLYFHVAKILLDNSERCFNRDCFVKLQHVLHEYKPLMLRDK